MPEFAPLHNKTNGPCDNQQSVYLYSNTKPTKRVTINKVSTRRYWQITKYTSSIGKSTNSTNTSTPQSVHPHQNEGNTPPTIKWTTKVR